MAIKGHINNPCDSNVLYFNRVSVNILVMILNNSLQDIILSANWIIRKGIILLYHLYT